MLRNTETVILRIFLLFALPRWDFRNVETFSKNFDCCCFYYFLRNSLVALLEALFDRILPIKPRMHMCPYSWVVGISKKIWIQTYFEPVTRFCGGFLPFCILGATATILKAKRHEIDIEVLSVHVITGLRPLPFNNFKNRHLFVWKTLEFLLSFNHLYQAFSGPGLCEFPVGTFQLPGSRKICIYHGHLEVESGNLKRVVSTRLIT